MVFKNVYKAATAYIAKGWAVFPVRYEEKVPALYNGLNGASKDPSLIQTWFGNNAPTNIGIRTGQESGIVVLDIDDKAASEEGKGSFQLSKLETEHGALPDTYIVETGSGGLHLYFLAPKEPMRNRAGVRPGIDFRADGGYVVAPPSTHENGRQYQVINDVEPAQMPTWLCELVRERVEVGVAKRLGDGGAGKGIPEGGRNDYLARVAGALQRRALSPESILAALLQENEEKCDPPLPEREVEAIVNSICRYEPESPILAQSTSLVVRASELAALSIKSISDKDKVKGLPTGIDGYDRMLGGGDRLGELTVLCASAKTGKSSWFHQLIYNRLRGATPVGYASREMSPESEVLPNLLSMEFQENAWLAKIDARRAAAYTKAIQNWPLYFASGYGYFPVDEIRQWFQELVTLGVSYFFVDHLHYCLEEPEEFKEAVKLAQELKTITKILNININLIVQPTKIADGQQLGLNALRGGAGIGQCLDNLFILERYKCATPNVAKLTLDVARSKLCKPGHIFVQYDAATTGFKEVEENKTELVTDQEEAPTWAKRVG